MTGDASRSDRARVEAAIADLSEFHSSDPAARPAIHAIALTRLTQVKVRRRHAFSLSLLVISGILAGDPNM